ncbi:MAG: 1-(5-phosphoribosyl)-5-amino-4-imidazole-carboxylate carboxylase, partial [Acaryochloridaceae cyanobacterium SU_2_1]|nr:1-(5-phosphoribosyl)-5-amino-4-imidazole-carboxylate carboxylase [Acaryochloridaceae cyanobacterium SU_2_1]
MTQTEDLEQLLYAVAQGRLSPENALANLQSFTYKTLDNFAKIDHHRALRTGFAEAIWGPGKTPQQILGIIEVMQPDNPCVIATRIEPAVFEQLQQQMPSLHYFAQARICATTPLPLSPWHPGQIGIVSAGTSDQAVVEEAAIAATLWGFAVQRFADVGV